MGTPHNHACAMRRTLDYATVTQVGIRSMSTEEAEAAPGLDTTIFYDATMRRDPAWIDRVVETLAGPVYITIDVDGLDPAIMPATGTPEPGGLSWYEMLALLRADIARHERRRVRPRRTQPDSGSDGAELPLRQADLQNPDVSVRPDVAVIVDRLLLLGLPAWRSDGRGNGEYRGRKLRRPLS